MTTKTTKLSKMLTLYRASEGIDQKDLASKIGIDKSTMNRIESGKSTTPETFLKVMSWMIS
jgi:DNA-binding XRE family transcriptional regulator